MASQPTTAGIITDESGERHIPESTRADGSTRRAIKIRPGYQPPEDVALYKNRTAESFRNRYKGGVPGADGLKDDASASALGAGAAASSAGTGGSAGTSSAAANKNAKRREARKKAAAAAAAAEPAAEKPSEAAQSASAPSEPAPAAEVDPEVEREKKARGLKKKLKQAKELKSKRDGGEALLPEQIAKVIRINELIRELDALGFDSEGEPKSAAAAAEEKGDDKTT